MNQSMIEIKMDGLVNEKSKIIKIYNKTTTDSVEKVVVFILKCHQN